MKLKKREITLNEADSLKDMYFLEKLIEGEYAKADFGAERKEAKNEGARLQAEAAEERAFLHKLWKKSLAEQL